MFNAITPLPFQPRAQPKATPVHYGGSVNQENTIRAGQYITSLNGQFYLTMQQDGNLVLYTAPTFTPDVAIWSSQTNGQGQAPHYAKVQGDGNFVVYDATNAPVWASDTWQQGQGPYKLVLQNDRNLVLYDGTNAPIWASNTYQQEQPAQVPVGQWVHQGGVVHQENVIRENEYVISPCYRYYLRMQADGNLVLYTHHSFQSNHAVWSTNTYGQGQGPYHAKVQQDGNFVVYDGTNAPIWASDTWNKGQAPYRLAVQRDKNVVLYDAQNQATWASNTWEQVPPNLQNQPEAQHAHGTTIHNEQSLHNGQYIQSSCGRYFLTMQQDGNLVLYSDKSFQSNVAVWDSKTWGKGQAPFYAKVQNDGNFVIYDRNNQPTWASDTWNKGQAPFRLVVQEDRNVVLYDANNQATWASNTYQA